MLIKADAELSAKNEEDYILSYNLADEDGDTPLSYALHYAAGRGESEIIKILLEAGAKPNFVDVESCDHDTPLHDVVENGDPENSKKRSLSWGRRLM